MIKSDVIMFERNNKISFECQTGYYLHLGNEDGKLYGLHWDRINQEFPEEAMLLIEARDYPAARKLLKETGWDYSELDLGKFNLMTRGEISPMPQKVTHTNCRDEEGITVGLLDGMIAMARILAKRNLGSEAVQEALKDFTADEDVKFIMNAVQDWSFGEEVDPDFPPVPAVVAQHLPDPVPVAKPWRVETKYHTWPMGWDKDVNEKFFGTREEVDAYLAEMKEWALAEDNRAHIRVYHNDRIHTERQFG